MQLFCCLVIRTGRLERKSTLSHLFSTPYNLSIFKALIPFFRSTSFSPPGSYPDPFTTSKCIVAVFRSELVSKRPSLSHSHLDPSLPPRSVSLSDSSYATLRLTLLPVVPESSPSPSLPVSSPLVPPTKHQKDSPYSRRRAKTRLSLCWSGQLCCPTKDGGNVTGEVRPVRRKGIKRQRTKSR